MEWRLFLVLLRGVMVLDRIHITTNAAETETEIELRLVDGRYPNEGRVEVRLPGKDTWGSYCSNPNPFYAGRLACRELGFPALFSATAVGQFGKGTGPIWLEGSSYEIHKGCEKLDDCWKNWSPRYGACDHRFDVGLVCFTGSIRLVGGERENEGRVELHLGGQNWVSLAYDSTKEPENSDFICRHLGYPFAVGATKHQPSSAQQKAICSYEACPLYELQDFFQCLDYLSLKLCDDHHNTPLLGVVCVTGVLLYGLTVFPCPKQTCQDRCGRPATKKLCGCDALCPLCNDCCYDYAERCLVQGDVTIGEKTETVKHTPSQGSFSCKIITMSRSVIVHGCSQVWTDSLIAQQCGNDSLPGPIKYRDGMLFQNERCAECNGIPVSELQPYPVKDVMVMAYDLGLDECRPTSGASEEVRSGCLSYSAPLTTLGDRTKYKNPHCAYCNGVDISAPDYCRYPLTTPAHLEILLDRKGKDWVPETSTGFLLLDEIHCFNKQYLLHIKPGEDNFTTKNRSLIAETALCYLTTLGWQNIQLTWPFYSKFIENSHNSTPTDDTVEVITPYLTNITDFEEILDGTVLPSQEEGSSRDWVVRCGVGQVDFVEICGTTVSGTQQPCAHSVYPTKTENLRAFNMSGVQVVYIGGGQLVQVESISYVRTYHHQPKTSNCSAEKETRVMVCGEIFESKECRTPLVAETKLVNTDDGQLALKYKGTIFEEGQVSYLPDDRVLICSSIFVTWEEPYISLTDPLTVLNTVGYILSIAALLVTFSNYCVFPVLRNVPGRAIMSLVAALILAQLLTLTVLDKAENQTFCIAMAVLMHFLWLSTFTWMNVLAFDLMKTFASKQAFRPNTKVFIRYCLYGWGVPLLVVTACLVIHLTAGTSIGFEYGGERSCWMVGRYAVLGALEAPMVCALIANALLFLLTVRTVNSSLRAAASIRVHNQKFQNRLRGVSIYVKISCVMGFTWMFGCLGRFINHRALWYVFVILNSLQGVFIFASFGCNIRIRKLWKKKLGMHAKRHSKVHPVVT